MRESTIEKYFVKRVKALGGRTRKVQWIGRRGANDRLAYIPDDGTAGDNMRRLDRLNWDGVSRGVLFWVEFKAPGEEPTEVQNAEHEMLKDGGALVVVIDSIEGVDRLLK